MSGSPQTIEEATALLNALPKPTSVACFVETLDRPLFAFATSSTVSAQPSYSRRSPRLFLRLNQLIISVVLEGESSFLVEFSQLAPGDLRSIKGELKFPLPETVGPEAPYARVLATEGTVCRVCHGHEERVESITFAEAYSSDAYRPNPMYRVPLASLVAEEQTCNWQQEPDRCELLSAVFLDGQVNDAVFDPAMRVFF